MQAARSGAAHVPSPLDSAGAHRAAATPPPDTPTHPERPNWPPCERPGAGLYVRAAELPPQIANNPYLRIETVDSAPPDVVVIHLKPERVQDPVSAAAAPATRKRS